MLKKKLNYFFFFGLLIFLIAGQSKSIYGGDSGDFVSAAYIFGISHPPGYPLYTLLGFLLSKIPYSTPAWRITLLSSIPSALSFVYLFKISKLLNPIKKNIFNFFTPLIFIFIYPVYLYSQVPEVFSLYLLFFILIIYFLLKYKLTKKVNYLYFLLFFSGLSLTHHHIILFLFPPAIFYLYKYTNIKKEITNKKTLIKLFLFFTTPLFIYSYVYFSAKTNPPIIWNNPINFSNFIDLVTRKVYGTFTSGHKALSQGTISRFLDIISFFRLTYYDFGIFGIFFALLGITYLFKFKKDIFFLFFPTFLIYLFFIYYAAFPLTIDFSVATYERFTITPYLFISFFVFFGTIYFYLLLNSLSEKFSHPKTKKLLILGYLIIVSIYSLSFLINNYPKISILKNDQTAENLAYDILTPLPKNSIVILTEDTPLFNTQYLHYANNVRPDIVVVHHSQLYMEYYQQKLKIHHPYLKVAKTPLQSTYQFIDKNKHLDIFINSPIKTEEGTLIPYGLLFRYNPNKPNYQKLSAENEAVWKTLHDPTSGSLSKYKNLMLADVLRVYAQAHYYSSLFYYQNKDYQLAEKHLVKAVNYLPDDAKINSLLAKTYFRLNSCQEAKPYLYKAEALDPNNLDNLFYLKEFYSNCSYNEKKAIFYRNLYLKKKKDQEGLLEKL